MLADAKASVAEGVETKTCPDANAPGNSLLTCSNEEGCTLIEDQQGDPDLTLESVSVSTKAEGRLQSAARRAVISERIDNFREKFFEKAIEFDGYNRIDQADEIKEFCNTLLVPFQYREKGKLKYTAYCAAGISYVASLLYAETYEDLRLQKRSKQQRFMPEIYQYHFAPTVSCVNMFHSALGTRRWRTVAEAKASGIRRGWVVLFDWRRSSSFYRADHCGIVDEFTADGKLRTIEFNTSPEGASGSQSDGGYVARRTREMSTVKGFIDTDAADPFSIFQ
ncbi:MAG: hypothetical protein AAFW81_00010 [Pseudomonadota bacterium]